MTATAIVLDVDAEVRAITATLAARRDPAYEAGMRRTVPSSQPAHATRVPDIRATAAEWRRTHRDVGNEELLRLVDALWATGWREKRVVAITLLGHARPALSSETWPRFVAWSSDIDNWEHVDHVATLRGPMLVAEPDMLGDIEALASSESGWQRRLSIVTVIVAFQKAGEPWRGPLEARVECSKNDKHPLVKRAVVWAKDRLKKRRPDRVEGGGTNG